MTELRELAERIAKLEDAFNAHCQEKAMCSAHVQTMASVVTRLDHTVYGNGKEGLTSIIARTDERLAGVIDGVNELPETIGKQIDLAIAGAFSKKPDEKKLSPADNALKWLGDRVLPYFVTGAFIILLQAIWELVRIKLTTP